MKLKLNIFFICVILVNSGVFGQFGYDLYGSAFGVNNINNATCGEVDSCFTLTPNLNDQIGAVWDNKVINLNYGFDASFCMYLGNNDFAGADGFAFVMRGIGSDVIGLNGSGLGFIGITPSLAIEFDTWENNGQAVNDIPSDHTAMYFNGNYSSPAVSAVSLLPGGTNVEDGAYHIARIVWNPTIQMMQMYFDGNLRFTYFGNIINNVFGGNNEVIWGFTSSTGGATNLQQICFPKYSINLNDVIACQGDVAAVHYYDPNMTSYTWTDQSGNVLVDWNTLDYPGPFDLNDSVFYTSTAGTYYLDIEINNQLVQDSMQVIFEPYPTAPFTNRYETHCFEEGNLNLNALNPLHAYLWNNGQSGQQITVTNSGEYHVRITSPLANCVTRDTIEIIDFCMDTTICENGTAVFHFYHDDFTSYKWLSPSGAVLRNWNTVDFSSGFNLADTSISVNAAGDYVLQFAINGENHSDTARLVVIENPEAPFLDDQLVTCLDDLPITLDAAYPNGTYTWSTGDSTETLLVTQAGLYQVTILDSTNLCSTTDQIVIESVCQTIITFPNVFTPDASDSLNAFYTVKLSNDFKWIGDFHFSIINRWGELVYEVTDNLPLWDGKIKGVAATGGVYFYICTYTDVYTGEKQQKHGNIQLIR